MSLSNNPMDIIFEGPATYRITVKGRINEHDSQYLGGMHVINNDNEVETKTTIITGEVKDQAELMGILNNIYELHIPILSMECFCSQNGTENRDSARS